MVLLGFAFSRLVFKLFVFMNAKTSFSKCIISTVKILTSHRHIENGAQVNVKDKVRKDVYNNISCIWARNFHPTRKGYTTDYDI